MLKIRLTRTYSGHGTSAIVEGEDGESIQLISVGSGGERRAVAVCASAARALREAATRFELLAAEARPYEGVTLRRINTTELGRGADQKKGRVI